MAPEQPNVDPATIFSILRPHELFAPLDDKALNALAREFEPRYLRSGEVLMQEGDYGRDFYMVLCGRLDVYKQAVSGKRKLAEVGSGEAVGEIAMLVDVRRTASVSALRDTVVLRLQKSKFDELAEKLPSLALGISKACISRLARQDAQQGLSGIRTVCMVPLSSAAHIDSFIQAVLSRIPEAAHVDSRAATDRFDPVGDRSALISWLSELEYSSPLTIYLADPENTAWTRLALRQADLVCFVADHCDDPHLRPAELACASGLLESRQTVLLLTHPSRTEIIRNTARWLDARAVQRCFHLVPSDARDMLKAARILTGRSIGLVLSGGGARGAAHVGVLKALEEAAVPIDFIGGTSMGAVVAALHSLGHSADEIASFLPDSLRRGGRLDYTYPHLSVAAGKNLVRSLIEYSGEQQKIEDLWTPMFCVAMDIKSNEEQVFDRGLLWQALRASASLPGIYPPVFTEGKVLVDGGTINNLPEGVMRDQYRVGMIIASLVQAPQEHIHYDIEAYSVSGWRLLWNRLNIFRKKRQQAPRLGDVLMRSMTIRDAQHQEQQLALSDYPIILDLGRYGMMDYKAIPAIIEEGYRQAKKTIHEKKINIDFLDS